ncbi:hypothetical protein GVAV_001429 [Gurleya vavrai]
MKIENSLPNYFQFIEHFHTNPFDLSFELEIKPTIDDLHSCLSLPETFYNSVYIFITLQNYTLLNLDIDINLMQSLCNKIFLDEYEFSIISTNSKNDGLIDIKNAVEKIKLINDDLAIKDMIKNKNLLELEQINSNNQFKEILNFVSNKIIIIETIKTKNKTNFLEYFALKNINLQKHQELLEILILSIKKESVIEFFDETQDEEILNSNLDFLEICLYIINKYLSQNKCLKEDFELEMNENLFLTKIKDLFNDAVFQNKKKSFSKSIFKYFEKYYQSMFILLKDIESLENDIYLVFKLSFSIYMLSFEDIKTKNFFKSIEYVVLCKDFLIREDLMLDLQKQIINNLSILKEKDLSANHLYLILSSDGIIYLKENNRTEFLFMLFESEVLNNEEKINIIRKANYNIQTNLDYDIKNNTVKKESSTQIILTFLEFISFFHDKKYFNEINQYIKEYIKLKNVLDFYANFLSKNELELPLWEYLQNRSIDEYILFSNVFFKKIRVNYNYLCKQKAQTEYSIIVDTHVTNFCKFFLEKKNAKLVPVLNHIPFLPVKKENFFYYYDIWLFIIAQELIEDVLFYSYKTPALVSVAHFLFKKNRANSYLKEKIARKFRKEKSDFFNYNNIEKNCHSVFLCIIFFTEYEKIRNFNFTGIIEYIKDPQILNICFNEMVYILKLIHTNLKMSHKYMLEYTLKLIETLDLPFESTKILIIEILDVIFQNNIFLAYNIEIHNKINNFLSNNEDLSTFTFVEGKINETLNSSTNILTRILNFYKIRILNVVQNTTVYFYNYIISCICNSMYFKEYRCYGNGKYYNIIQNALNDYLKIDDFSKKTLVNENFDSNYEDLTNQKFKYDFKIDEFNADENIFKIKKINL